MKSNHAGAVFIKSPHRNKPQANICLIVTRNRQIEESASHTCTAQTLTTDGGKLQQRAARATTTATRALYPVINHAASDSVEAVVAWPGLKRRLAAVAWSYGAPSSPSPSPATDSSSSSSAAHLLLGADMHVDPAAPLTEPAMDAG